MSEPEASRAGDVSDRRAHHGRVDAFRWCSKWPDELASVFVVGRDGQVRRARPDEVGARRLSSQAISVGSCLGRRADNETACCKPRLATICEATSLPPRTVQRAIRELKLAGVLEVKRRMNASSVYKLLPIGPRLAVVEGGATVAPPWRDHDATQAPTVAPPRRDHGATQARGDATVASLLTAVGTTHWTTPPPPPKGGRARDRDRYRDDFRAWAAAQGLPVDVDALSGWVQAAIEYRGLSDRASIVAYLEEKTEWRDGQVSAIAAAPAPGSTEVTRSSVPLTPAGDDDPPAPAAQSRQLSFGGEGW